MLDTFVIGHLGLGFGVQPIGAQKQRPNKFEEIFMRFGFLLCSLASLLVLACGGSDETASSSGLTSSSGSTGSSSSGAGGNGTGGAAPGGAGPGSEKIIFNEINAFSPLPTDFEWVEIVNTGDTPFNLGAYAFADSDSAAPGMPKLTDALRFPAEAVIPAKAYWIILGAQTAEPTPIAHPDCLATAPAGTVCYYAPWKISASLGERLFFLAPNNDVITTADYPNSTIVIPAPVAGQTWARLPDTTGEFGIGKPTPGAPNAMP